MEENGSIHAGHRERLRERYREAGLDHFTDHEILELLLGYTILQKDTNPIAHRLIEQFGSLRGVLEAGEEKLERVNLVGPPTAFFLSMIPDETDLASQFEARRAGEIMNRCLGKLSKDDRRIFVMRYWLSMSYDQIRTQTGFGESKIKMSLSRTRAKLADELKKEGITV